MVYLLCWVWWFLSCLLIFATRDGEDKCLLTSTLWIYLCLWFILGVVESSRLFITCICTLLEWASWVGGNSGPAHVLMCASYAQINSARRGWYILAYCLEYSVWAWVRKAYTVIQCHHMRFLEDTPNKTQSIFCVCADHVSTLSWRQEKYMEVYDIIRGGAVMVF